MALKRLRAFIFLGISLALLSSSCNSADRVLDIPTGVNTAPKSIEAIKDYQEALNAIVRVMVSELELPAPRGRVYFYGDAWAYQVALVAEVKTHVHWPEKELKEIRQLRDQSEFELFKRTLDLANRAGAVTMGQKVFVAEWSMKQVPWRNRVSTLAHELTHVVQASLGAGRAELMHRWLMEGFAEWVSFKVVDALGAKDFFNDQMRQACGYEIANLRQLKSPESWLQAKGSPDPSRYWQSACAVHYMAIQHGVPAILEYFRLFRDTTDAAQNFTTAFGQSSDAFEQELRAQVKSIGD
jgi:hypothetical protein